MQRETNKKYDIKANPRKENDNWNDCNIQMYCKKLEWVDTKKRNQN